MAVVVGDVDFLQALPEKAVFCRTPPLSLSLSAVQNPLHSHLLLDTAAFEAWTYEKQGNGVLGDGQYQWFRYDWFGNGMFAGMLNVSWFGNG